jgi:hypothetical protein
MRMEGPQLPPSLFAPLPAGFPREGLDPLADAPGVGLLLILSATVLAQTTGDTSLDLFLVTPDGRSYVHAYENWLADLYLAEGVR